MENREEKPLTEKVEEEGENNGQESEEVSEEFLCCVCLDLLYKPVVLGCGHISCFWCVFNAMDAWQESHCPLCRHPYNHFPSICHLLHFLLLKLYPVAYKSRERQVGEEEKKVGNYSPQFDCQLCGPFTSKDYVSSPHYPTHQQRQLDSGSSCSGKMQGSSSMHSLENSVHCPYNAPPEIPLRRCEATTDATTGKCCLSENKLERMGKVSVDELACGLCKKLLFRPVVLNCGHVYCESCIMVPNDGIPRCQVCQSLHPNGFPSVCLILDHFLEEQFPEIYTERQEALLETDCRNLNAGPAQAQQRPIHSPAIPSDVYSAWLYGNGPNVHVGVGCDSCWMSPIIGERYKCKDCVEKIGFDLCETCYNTPSKIPGRFNQQHKPEHKFEKAPPRSISDLIFRLNAEFPEDDDEPNVSLVLNGVSRAPITSDDVPLDPNDHSYSFEDVSPAFIMSVDDSIDPEDDSDDPVSSRLT